MRFFLLAALIGLFLPAFAQNSFRVVPLGVHGGTTAENLSAYLVAPAGSEAYVSLDAGTIYHGIVKSIESGALKGDPTAFLRRNIKGYLISHAHIDHTAGVILNSIEDSSKVIYSLPECLRIMQTHYFNWESWPNMTKEGNAPRLGKYRYETLIPGKEIPLTNTNMTVQAFPLSHSNPYESAAFLVKSAENAVLYFGDTGPDAVEKKPMIAQVWEAVAPLVKAGRLKGIFLETSYPDAQPDDKLYGHLTPSWLMKTMDDLAVRTGAENVKGLKIIITHMKPDGPNKALIRKQLEQHNTRGFQLIFPEQAVAFDL